MHDSVPHLICTTAQWSTGRSAETESDHLKIHGESFMVQWGLEPESLNVFGLSLQTKDIMPNKQKTHMSRNLSVVLVGEKLYLFLHLTLCIERSQICIVHSLWFHSHACAHHAGQRGRVSGTGYYIHLGFWHCFCCNLSECMLAFKSCSSVAVPVESCL